MSVDKPYVSFVMGARNDTYGGDFLHRIQVSIGSLLEQAKRYDLDAEFIIVEWNPPEDRARLAQAIKWPEGMKKNSVRIIEVTKENHLTLPNSNKMPMFEYIAKNTGIRRARGEFIVSTNPDLMFSNELIEFMAQKKLSKDNFYRIDRFDVHIDAEIPLTSVDDQLKFCKKNLVMVRARGRAVGYKKIFPVISDLRFNYLHKKGNEEDEQKGRDGDIHNMFHLHAAGDFHMMSKEMWNKSNGFIELKSHSFIDSLHCFTSGALGLKEYVFHDPYRIYHQEHDRTEASTRPSHFDADDVLKKGEDMLKRDEFIPENGEEWGLGNFELKEYVV